ncbi:MAG: class SAM-dependent methyltransferase [Nitrososphaeraceae archaeon]|jgi:ubiquinone/menaquinone biosynthesis C-methylase UbiE|nr:class SAM-dependent methyltransferase [Nitrososphaeraceae archaeon]
MANTRWKRAQIAEKKFWHSTRNNWSAQNPALYWQGILSHGFNIDYRFFAGKSVLEIGCGPTGIIFELDNAQTRVGLEPMDLGDLISDEKKKLIVKKGIGEEIPYPDNSFDIILSFNALDHSIDPPKVLREIHRVLHEGGDFLLWIYVLRDRYKFLQNLLNRLDPPHPFHFTVDQLMDSIRGSWLQEKYRRDDNGTGLPNNTLKKTIANGMMNTLWLWSVKEYHN